MALHCSGRPLQVGCGVHKNATLMSCFSCVLGRDSGQLQDVLSCFEHSIMAPVRGHMNTIQREQLQHVHVHAAVV